MSMNLRVFSSFLLITLLSSACAQNLEGTGAAGSTITISAIVNSPTSAITDSPSPSITPSPSATFPASPSPTGTPALVSTFTPPPTLTLPSPQAARKIYPSCHPVEVPFDPFSFPNPPASPIPSPSLRSLASARGLWLGTAVDGGHLFEAPYAELVRSQFNLLTPENAMKWQRLQPQRGVYDFREADALVAFAEQNGMAVYGHPLVWHLQLPDWVLQGKYSRAIWIQILCSHVKTVVNHYRGRILVWNVVNEAMANEGFLYDNIWLTRIGPEYIDMAFQWAHEADPQAILAYNDHSAEGLNPKSNAIYSMIKTMVENGVPIHAVGLQMHISLINPPSHQDLTANMHRLANLGLQAHITEMDVRIQYGKGTRDEKLALQAEIYHDILSVCLEQPNCRFFSTWGASDQHSWIPGITGRPDAPLLFDEQGQAKPAYEAFIELLSQP